MIANRGNPSLLKSLQASAKQVSKQNGISNLNVIGESKIQVKPINNTQLDYNATGAYASMMKKNSKELWHGPKRTARNASTRTPTGSRNPAKLKTNSGNSPSRCTSSSRT